MEKIISLKNIKVGDKLTLVNKGICRSAYSDRIWIDTQRKGRAYFFEVSKVGRKYLYGYHMYVDTEEGLKRQYWEDKINPEDVIIYEGFNKELKEIYREYVESLRNYDEFRRKAMYQIDREVAQTKNVKVDVWDKANPRPKALNIE